MKTSSVKRLVHPQLWFCFYAIRSDIFEPIGQTGMFGFIAFVFMTLWPAELLAQSLEKAVIVHTSESISLVPLLYGIE